MTRTQKHVENVNKLIKGFKSLPKDYKHFHMGSYVNHVYSQTVMYHEGLDEYFTNCGSTACAVGHDPAFGIPMKHEYTYGHNGMVIDWGKYSTCEFGFDNRDAMSFSNWDFCFSPDWSDDIPQLIERLQMANTGNIPNVWRYTDRFKDGVQL